MNIYDIAKKSGVSIATVSRVLNQSESVSTKTRGKVLRIMAEEGYTPNAFARGLGLDTMRMVGILCTDVSDLYYAKAVALTEKCLRERGFGTLLCCTGPALADKKQALELLQQKRVDAFMLLGSAFRENRDNSHLRQAAEKAPVVIINGLVSSKGVYSVLCDEKEAMKENVRLLAQRGCKRILYLYDANTYSGQQKLGGYREGVSECGLTALVKQTPKDLDVIRQAVAGLSEPFDGVLSSEDLLAVGALKALERKGLKLPVIGFNNSLLAGCASPTLTSVDNMLNVLCPAAVDLLVRVLEGEEQPHKTVVAARLVERESFQVLTQQSG